MLCLAKSTRIEIFITRRWVLLKVRIVYNCIQHASNNKEEGGGSSLLDSRLFSSICRKIIYKYQPTGPSTILRLTKVYHESTYVKPNFREQEQAIPYPNRNFRCMEFFCFFIWGGGLVKMINTCINNKQYLFTEMGLLILLNFTLKKCMHALGIQHLFLHSLLILDFLQLNNLWTTSI